MLHDDVRVDLDGLVEQARRLIGRGELRESDTDPSALTPDLLVKWSELRLEPSDELRAPVAGEL